MAPVRMTHKPSLSQSVFSMALPLFSDRICAVLARVTPMANACSLPAWEAGWLRPRPAALRRLLSAPDHASGCPEPRPASVNQPVRLHERGPPHRPLLSTWLRLPSAKIATVVPSGTSSILPPADVSPGAMMLAPDRTKRIAPRSTWNFGRMSGYLLGGSWDEHVPS